MKLGKKLLAVLLAVLLMGLISIPAFAAEDKEICPDCGQKMLTLYLTYAPTCEAQGYTLWKCATPDCGHSEERDTVAALGHDYTMTHKDGDCTHSTYDLYTCGRCGKSYKDNVIAAAGHVWGPATHEVPTCTTYERDKYVCAVCAEVMYEKTVGGNPAVGHYMELTKRPETCADDGYSTYTCSVCGYENKIQTEKPVHTDADGDNICDVCGKELEPVKKEEDYGFYAKIIRWITDIIEAFKSLIAGIKG